MVNSDDEADLMPGVVTNYHFVDEKEEPICFSTLPIQWHESGSLGAPRGQVFLHGKTEDGLQKMYKQVVAWKVKIEGVCPEVWVLSRDKRWLKLLRPRKAYEDTIRKILVTLQCLFYLKKNPMSSGKSLWDHVRKVFSRLEVRASEYDLLDHRTFIKTVVKRDEMLSKSQLLFKYLNDLPKKKVYSEALHTNQKFQKSDFINDGDIGDYDEGCCNADGHDCFDTVCVLCDNGGEVLCCEGDCLRSFHAIKDTGVDSHCITLGYTRTQVEDIPSFHCLNCLHHQHQCFACGKLGNSNRDSGAEVFRCISASCGHFYHPHCAAKQIHPDNEVEASELADKIAAGVSFTCSIHKCVACKQGENKGDRELQFAMCRRCPTSYHRKCLPRRISFEDVEEEGIIRRAWDDLIPDRILIYCLRHKIDKTIGTPLRNHIIFPGTSDNRIACPVDSSKAMVLMKRKAEDLSGGKISKKLERAEAVPFSVGTSSKALFGPVIASYEKQQSSCMPKNIFKDREKKGPVTGEGKMSMREEKKTSSMINNESEPHNSLSRGALSSEQATAFLSRKRLHRPVPLIDEEIKKRIILLVKRSPSSSWTVKDLLENKNVPSTYAHHSRHVGKTIAQGRVEVSVQAIRAALHKIENGCSIEDAKAVCGPDILSQMLRWKSKLRVYLAPFLHGMRYTSYGRHFTKVNKLKEIVERLHWYVQNGDMIVDFCCGANDFSLLMKEKLEATGKQCLFQNYDIFQPKKDFNFERRDWMTVQPTELPTGSQLIMGLNPPFGVKAALANKFIDKALEFKPKLLILVVPEETERLDKKPAAYDLIWEDEQELSGKSFYLPGSIDADEKQLEQWNLKPPLLYLWSRPDWTTKHKAVAVKHGHSFSVHEKSNWVAGKEFVASVHVRQYHGYGIQNDVFNDMPEMQRDQAEGCIDALASPYGQADHKGLENYSRSKDRREIAVSDMEKCHVNSCKQRSGKPEETLMSRSEDNLPDMDISPPHYCQYTFGDHLSFDAETDRTTAIGSFHRPASGLEMACGGDPNGALLAGDTDHVEQGYTTSIRKPFSSSSYDWLTNDDLSYDIRGNVEQFPGHVRGSPIRHLHPERIIGRERPSRPDSRALIGMYGQQHLIDSSSGSYMNGMQTGSFSSPSYGLLSSTLRPFAMQRYDHRPDELNCIEQAPSVPSKPPPTGDGSMSGSSPLGSQIPFPGHGSSCGWLDD